MPSEQEALSSLKLLRGKELHGEPVHARIKNESRIMVINRLISACRGDASEDTPAFFGAAGASFFSSANMADTPASDLGHANRKGTSSRGKGRGKRNRRHAENPKPIVLPQLSVGEAGGGDA